MMTMKTNLTAKPATGRSLRQSPGSSGHFDIVIRASGVELDEQLQKAVLTKIGRVRQYAPRAFRARVHLEREHAYAGARQYRVTVRYEIPGNDLIAEHRAQTPRAALDVVAEKIERRLRKRKTARLAGRHGRRARACRIADYCGTRAGDPLDRR